MSTFKSTQSEDVVARGTSNSERNGDKDSTEEAEKSQTEQKGKEKAKEVKSARVMYSLDELLDLRDSPASKLWPSVLAEEYVRDGMWDPEVWHQSLESFKRCASPVEDIRRQVIKEDGIVLSPQRQSFGQGCHAPHSAPEKGSQQDRIKSMIGRSVDRERDGRSRLTGRVGRGRNTDYLERTPLRDRNRDPNDLRRPGPRDRDPRDREHRDRPPRDRDLRDRFDRGEHQDRPKRSRDEDSYSRNNRGRSRTVGEEEPEWVAHGPTSQFDTIELRGFDQEENRRRGRENGKKPVNGEVDLSTPKSSNSPLLEDGTSAKTATNTDTPHDAASEEENVKDDDGKGFDINQFFMSETILPFSGGIEQVSSRFSQFFGSGSRSGSRSNSRTGSRRSSVADDFIEFSGYSSPRPASPAQEFMFTPITPPPPDLETDPEILANILQKTKINVKPLLDSVLSSGVEPAKVKGELQLADIEAELEAKRVVDQKNKENLEHIKEPTDLTAFNMLVQTMKTTGSLPEKPSPAIPGLPSHLLPRPPSPKRKTPRRTPSPSLKSYQRCLSPAELLKQVAMQASLPAQRPPSPAQVVPQMERSFSPFGMHAIATPPQDLFGSPVLRRSPSPLSVLAQRRPVPLLGPNAFGSSVLYTHQSSPNAPPVVVRPTPQSARPLGRTPGMQQRCHDGRTGRQNEPATPKSAPPQTAKGSPSLTSMSFMPTSVMKKMHNQQKTPRGSNNEERRESKDSTASPARDSHLALPQKNTPRENSKGKDNLHKMETELIKDNQSTEVVNGSPERSRTSEPREQMSPVSQLRQQLARHEPSVINDRGQQPSVAAPDQRQNSQLSELNAALSSPRQRGQQEATEKKTFSPILQQPSAFRPPALSPQANSSVRPDGSHSEPQTPYHGSGSSSLKQPPRAQPHSAPSTPQRHPLANRAALLTRDQAMEHEPARPSAVKDNWVRELTNDHRPLHSEAKPQFAVGHPIGPPVQNGPLQQDSKQTVSSSQPPRRNSFEGHFDHPRQQDTFRRAMPMGEMKQNLTPQEMNQYRMRQESLMRRQGSPFAGGRASPPMVHPMQGLPPRSQFMPPYGPMPMSPQGAMHPGLVGPVISPAYLARYGMVSPGMASQGPVTPNQPTMPVPHPAARYPMVPPGQAPFLYGPRPSPSYPPINPTAMMSQHPQAHQVHPMRMAPQFIAGGRASPSTVPQRHGPSPQSVREPADSNPLTKWFSADVLKHATPRASTIPDVSRKMLSVEELERQQTAVHN